MFALVKSTPVEQDTPIDVAKKRLNFSDKKPDESVEIIPTEASTSHPNLNNVEHETNDDDNEIDQAKRKFKFSEMKRNLVTDGSDKTGSYFNNNISDSVNNNCLPGVSPETLPCNDEVDVKMEISCVVSLVNFSEKTSVEKILQII